MNLEMAMERMKLRISWYILMANHFRKTLKFVCVTVRPASTILITLGKVVFFWRVNE